MSTPQYLLEQNRARARQINQEARCNPQSPYVGKFIALVDGQVVGVASTWGDLVRLLDEKELNSQAPFCWEVGVDFDEPEEIWGLR